MEILARRRRRWALRWFRRKALAPLTIAMAAGNRAIALACPAPSNGGGRITMAHGGGGRLTQQLIERVFLPAFSNDLLGAQHDGASMEIGGARLAFTTDSYVVRPLEFPGGTIGDLAVNGTVNDLAMCGARPLYLSAGFILEEGLPMETLQTRGRLDARGGRTRRSADCDRRHQGGRSRERATGCTSIRRESGSGSGRAKSVRGRLRSETRL